MKKIVFIAEIHPLAEAVNHVATSLSVIKTRAVYNIYPLI